MSRSRLRHRPKANIRLNRRPPAQTALERGREAKSPQSRIRHYQSPQSPSLFPLLTLLSSLDTRFAVPTVTMRCFHLRPLAVAALFMELSVSHASFGRRHSSPVAAETLVSGPGGQAGPEPTEAPIAPGELRKRQLAESESSRAGTCGYEYVGSSLCMSP
jgi:hypothetical protein